MYEAAYGQGRTFDEFVARAEANREMWSAMAARARLHPDEVARAAAAQGSWRFLVLADDWCGDAVNTLPVAVRMAETLGIGLRIVGREEHPGLMERHLTAGARSIPVVILLDAAGQARGWWGPRPAELQAWFETEGRPLPKPERYRALRRWYARDRGRSTARELADLLLCAAGGGRFRGTRPCPELQAA